MEPKPLLFPFLYEVQEASTFLSENESTSIYKAPVLRRASAGVAKELENHSDNNEVTIKEAREDATRNEQARGKIQSIALKNRKLIRGVVLRNEFARLLVETEDGPQWISKSQIMQIFE